MAYSEQCYKEWYLFQARIEYTIVYILLAGDYSKTTYNQYLNNRFNIYYRPFLYKQTKNEDIYIRYKNEDIYKIHLILK